MPASDVTRPRPGSPAATAASSERSGGAAKTSCSSSAAVAAKIRLRYAKTGKVRFVSAIDLGRIWERSLRRADLPIAYSEGFSPHPKVSFPDALPLGYSSTGEYAELTFAGPIAVGPAMDALNAVFPEGLAVLDAVAVVEGAPRLSRWLRASAWDLRYPRTTPAGLFHDLSVAALAADRLLVQRERKGASTEVDLRPALHQISTDGTTVRTVLHHVEPPVRPSEVHLALRALAGSLAADLAEPEHLARVAQGTVSGDGLVEALSGASVEALGALADDERRHADDRQLT